MANNNGGNNGNKGTRTCNGFCDGSCGKLPKGAQPIFFCEDVLKRLSELNGIMEQAQATIDAFSQAKATAPGGYTSAIDDMIAGMEKDKETSQAEFNKLIIETVSKQLP